MLEIKLPREITKSPAAMELFISALWSPGGATTYSDFLQGRVFPWYSLEIVSIGGSIHFYIWSDSKKRNMIEHQIYAQYPNVEVHVAKDDYALKVHHDPDKYIMWGTYFKKKNKAVYPIKTYTDYELDSNPKEEHKIDPLTAMLEYLGSLKPGEQVWLQILIRAHKDLDGADSRKAGSLKKIPFWKEVADKEIEKIRKETVPQGKDQLKFPNPTKGQQERIAAIERSQSKLAFDTMIRAFYIAEKPAFNSVNIPGLIGSVRQYWASNLNWLKLGNFTDHSDNLKDIIFLLDWNKWFQSFMRKRRDNMEALMLDAYKKRSVFYYPYRNYRCKPYAMTTEELATIFHFPGEVAATPTFERIPSKKAGAPANLPV